MNIIGHRGASNLALENTLEGIQAALKAGVDAIEFDIRITSDQKIVLCHDKHLGRISSHQHHVNDHPLKKLKKILLHNGQKIPTLTEAIKIAGTKPLFIEGKDDGWAQPLAVLLKKQKYTSTFRVISFNIQELYTFSLLAPKIPVYALEKTNPFEVIRIANVLGFSGVDMNFWLLNPLTYVMARFHKLDIIVYTVNKPWLARFLHILYPRISITTDVPDQMQFLRKKKHR